MHINEAIVETKAKVAYSKRRVRAVKAHGKTVVTTGVEAAKTVAAVALQNLRSAAETQKATVLDRDSSLITKVRQVRRNAQDAATTLRADLTAAVKDGYHAVRDRIEHMTDVTHKEQAVENKIERKVKKARKIAAKTA